MSAQPASVVQALTAVMGELGGIGKDDRSPEGYSYRGIEAITRRLQPLLARHGIVIVPSLVVDEIVPSPAMKDGWTDTRVHVDWRIYGPGGDHLDARTAGIGRDRADKGSNKAQTQAYKYLLLHLLCVADAADDTDGHTYPEPDAEPVGPDWGALGWEGQGAHDARMVAVRASAGELDEASRSTLGERWHSLNFRWPLSSSSMSVWEGLVGEARKAAGLDTGEPLDEFGSLDDERFDDELEP